MQPEAGPSLIVCLAETLSLSPGGSGPQTQHIQATEPGEPRTVFTQGPLGEHHPIKSSEESEILPYKEATTVSWLWWKRGLLGQNWRMDHYLQK